MSPAGEDRATTADPAEAERTEHPDSFNPGPETGYLRRGHRDHDLDVDSGAGPFDPGPDHYDDRRAKREAKKAEKAERKRRDRDAKDRAARERAEKGARKKGEAARRERAEGERRAGEEARRAERERIERENDLRAKRESARRAEAEKAARAQAERERLRRAERGRAERARGERRRAVQAERERRDAELKAERERVATERAERDRAERDKAERERARRQQPAPEPEPRGTVAVAAPPKPKLKPSERLKLQDMNLAPAGKPSREPAAPSLSHKPAHASLRLPTAKVGAALLTVTAMAALAGSALGLPVPGLGDDSASDGSGEPTVDAASLALLDGGTPVGLSKGPYHPVVGEVGYGESAAKFGASRSGRRHEGQDVFAKPGTPLVSVRDGVVVDGGAEDGRYSGGRGNYIVVYSQLDGRSYVYLHLLEPALVAKGEAVEAGQPLGQVGCTGSCYGPHLHFEVRNGRQTLRAETKAVDPMPLLREWPSIPVPSQG